MNIDTVPPFPLRSQGLTQASYSAGVEASLSAMPTFIQQLNAVGSAYALTTNGSSTSSVAIGTGSKSFTAQVSLGYIVGMTLRIANSSTNYMTGDVTSYNVSTGALVMNITSVTGSGTFASWSISMAAVGANSAATISFSPAGNISASTVQAAIQELDTEKLSSAAGAVTGTNLEDIITGGSVGGSASIPVITYDANGRITNVGSASFSTNSHILLGTLITTSGTTQTLSGLTLTGYKQLFIELNGVSHNSGTAQIFKVGSAEVISNVSAANALYTAIQLALVGGGVPSYVTGQPPSVSSGVTNASTSITFSFSAGSFDNGSILVYGVK